MESDEDLRNMSRNQECANEDTHISAGGGYKQHSCLHFVRDAVYAVAYALHNMQKDLCNGTEIELCDEMKHIENKNLIQYLQDVHFKGKPHLTSFGFN